MVVNLEKITRNRIFTMIVLLTFIVYGNSINNEYSLDDDLVAYHNSTIEGGISSIPEIFTKNTIVGEQNSIYRPLPLMTFAIEKQFFKKLPEFQLKKDKSKKDRLTQANVSHLINVLLYAFTCCLIFVLFRIIFSEYNLLLPVLVVLLFLAHPLHTEPVNNLKSRDELLMLIFALLSVYQYLKFSLQGSYFRVLFGFLFFVLALFSKDNGIIVLGMLPVILYYKNIKFNKIALCTLASVFGFIGFVYVKENLLSTPGIREFLFFENPLFFEDSIIRRVSVGFYCALFYLKMLIFPRYLSFYYGYNQIPMADFSYWQTWLSMFIFLPAGVYGGYLFVKRKVIGLGLVLWFGMMLGVINVIFPIVGIVADRFSYTFSLGFCIVLAYSLLMITKTSLFNHDVRVKLSKMFVLIVASILIVYSGRVVARNFDWHDHLSLFENDIKHLKNSAKGHALLANTLYPLTIKKLQTNPNDVSISNDVRKIIYHYEEAIKIDSTYLKSINNLASSYAIFTKEYSRAIKYSEMAIKIRPNYLEAYFNLAYSYDAINDYQNALKNYIEVININPNYTNAYVKLELLLIRFNKMDEGVVALDSLADDHKTPKNIYFNIANFIGRQSEQNIDEALHYFVKAFHADETDRVLCNHIIKLYEIKNNQEKILQYKKYLN